jgi:hypothetical protein
VISIMMTLILQAVGFNPSRDVGQSRATNMASTYVPMESWVYPSFDRLATEEYVPSAIVSLRPWTCFPLLAAAPKRNDEFTIQLSYTPIGRAK